MGLIIAVPFILVSFIMGIWAKKNPAESSFRRFILLILGIAVLAESALTNSISLTQSSFIGALALAYMANLVQQKYLSKLFEVSALSFMALTSYIQGTELIYLALSTLLIILSYYCLNSYKNEVAFTLVQIVPIGIAGLYLQNTLLPFILTFMALFGCARYFIENKSKTIPKFFIQSYLLILFMLLNSFSTSDFMSNFVIILAGCSFMILSQFVERIIRHKHSIITRLFNQHQIRFLFTIKVCAFNVIAIVTAFLVKLNYLSIYILIGFIILVLSYGFAKMWYLDNQHKF